jgi:hypothetical protein
MAQKVGELEAELLLEISQFVRDARKAESTTEKLGRGFKAFGRIAAVATAAAAVGVAFFAKEAVSAAADAQETLNLLGETFGEATQDVIAFTDDVSKATGRSRFELREMAADLGAVAVALTGSREAGAEMATQLTALSVDVASFRNLQDVEVLEKFKSGITGEAEALKSLGIVMLETNLKSFALRKGFGDFKKLDEATKAQVRFQFILEKSADAMGDAERTSAGLANRQRALGGIIKDTSTAMGQELVPVTNALVGVAIDLVKAFAQDEDSLRDFVRNGVDFAVDSFAFLASIGFDVQVAFQRIKQGGAAMAGGLVSAFAEMQKGVAKFERGLAGAASTLGFEDIAAALEADAAAGDELAKSADAIAAGFVDKFNKAGIAVDELRADQAALGATLQRTKGELRFEAEQAGRMADEAGKGKAEIEKLAAAALKLADIKAFKKFAEDAKEAGVAISEFLDPTVLTITAAEAEERLAEIRDRLRDIANMAPVAKAALEGLKEEVKALAGEEAVLTTVIEDQRAVDEERRDQMVGTATALGDAFGSAFGQMVSGATSAEEAFKGFIKNALLAVVDAAEQALLAQAAEAAGGQAKFVFESIPPPGSFAVAAGIIAATIGVFRGIISGFQEGGKVGGFGRGDSVFAMLEPGEFVMTRSRVDDLESLIGGGFPAALSLGGGGGGGSAGGITVNLKVETVAPLTDVEIDNMLNRRLVPAIRRARKAGRL